MMKKILILAVLVLTCIACNHQPQKYIYSTNNTEMGVVQEFRTSYNKNQNYYIKIRDINTGNLKEMEIGREDYRSWWTGDTIVGYNVKEEID